MIKTSDFKKDGKSRFIYEGKSISRRQRDKLLGVGEYSPKERAVKTRKKYAPGLTRHEKEIIRAGGREAYNKKRREKRAAKLSASLAGTPLSEEQRQDLIERWGKAYNIQGRVREFSPLNKLVPDERTDKDTLIKHLLIWTEHQKQDDIKLLRRLYKKRFKDVAEYQAYIEKLLDDLGYRRPDWNKYT